MRKLILAIAFVIIGLCIHAQDSLTHQSVIVYGLKGFSLVLVSQSIADSLLDLRLNNTQSVSKERVVFVYGDLLKIFLTTSKQPFLHPVNEVKFDTDTKDNDITTIEELEIRRGLINYGQYTNWMDMRSFPVNTDSISLFPLTRGTLPVTKGDLYLLFASAVIPYHTRVLSIRNKKTKEELLNFRLQIKGPAVRPFLTLVTQNNSEKNFINSFHKKKDGTAEIPDLSEFLSQEESNIALEASERSGILRIENLNEISDLVFYFKKQHSVYPDSSMEFRLTNESDKGAGWIKTGHRLTISQLASGTHYRLLVRYELHPAHIQEYTFYVVPKWYQTTEAKIILAGGLILIALLTWLAMYRRLLNKSKRRREQLSLEIKSIRSQLNPHFIFNALSSIQGLINKNNIPAANHYLTEFSTLLRESLHNNDKEMVPLVTELKLLETYLSLEQLRFSFKYEINIDRSIDKTTTEIPNLILQPLVENAVKHGVSTLGEKGLIKIDFLKKSHNLLVLITDNGNTFDVTKTYDGFGLKLTNNRISLLRQTLKDQPIVLTIARKEGMKTIVNLEFTNWI
jgi:two-component sensor histidine kinase